VATIDSTEQPCPVTSLVQRGSVEQGVERGHIPLGPCPGPPVSALSRPRSRGRGGASRNHPGGGDVARVDQPPAQSVFPHDRSPAWPGPVTGLRTGGGRMSRGGPRCTMLVGRLAQPIQAAHGQLLVDHGGLGFLAHQAAARRGGSRSRGQRPAHQCRRWPHHDGIGQLPLALLGDLRGPPGPRPGAVDVPMPVIALLPRSTE